VITVLRAAFWILATILMLAITLGNRK